MSMTREEARIEIQSLKDTFEELEPGGTRTQFALEIALTALRPIRREQVEKMKKEPVEGGYDELYAPTYKCPECGFENTGRGNFCRNCGCLHTDEAVDMMMERMEKMKYIGIPNEFEDIFRGVELSGVELSEDEIRTLNWIIGWDRQTVENLRSVIQKAQAIALSTLTPPNEPLTIEQLREMDGEPVWIVEQPDWGHWELSADAEDYLANRDQDFYGLKHDDPAGRYGLHVLGWLAYRRPPEGEEERHGD